MELDDAAPEPERVGVSEIGGRQTRVEVYAELGSTNTRLRERAAEGAAEGTVIVARAQTAGRGRLGRTWNSPPDAGLYASILERPGIEASRSHVLTLAAAIAVAEAISGLGVTGVEIKWPNDVLANGRKISGILTESSLLDGRIDSAVVGIGVNVRRTAVPEDLIDRATSLENEGVVVEPSQVLTRVLERLAVWRPRAESAGDEAIVSRWLDFAPMAMGATVHVADGAGAYDAVTEGITDDGRLRVRKSDGLLEILTAADVTLRNG